MSDPFESSRRKLARAEEHFVELQRKITEFTQVDPYTTVIEPHPEKPDHEVHKVKLTTPLPDSIGDITGDLVYNLRSALDNAGYAVAVASGRSSPKNTAFPFAGSVAQMANSLVRSKDIPEQIQSLFCGFEPYKGGDDLLWALNQICNGDKHKMVIPIGTGLVRVGAKVRGRGFFEMPDPHVWDRTKNEMVLIAFGPKTEFKYDFDFRIFVAFNEVQIVDGQPVVRVLHRLGRKVQRILVGIEAESRRLGFVK